MNTSSLSMSSPATSPISTSRSWSLNSLRLGRRKEQALAHIDDKMKQRTSEFFTSQESSSSNSSKSISLITRSSANTTFMIINFDPEETEFPESDLESSSNEALDDSTDEPVSAESSLFSRHSLSLSVSSAAYWSSRGSSSTDSLALDSPSKSSPLRINLHSKPTTPSSSPSKGLLPTMSERESNLIPRGPEFSEESFPEVVHIHWDEVPLQLLP